MQRALHHRLRAGAAVWLLAGLAALGGCALSPQLIALRPSVSVPSSDIGHGRAVYIQVLDRRAQEAFGTRGGVYSHSDYIKPEGDIRAPIRAAVAAGLVEKGFTVTPDPAASALRMKVEVEAIGYQGEGSPTVTKVKTWATVRVRVEKKTDNTEQSYTGQYEANSSEGVIMAPGAEKNARLINDIVSKVIERMLGDQQLLRFLGS